MAYCVARTLDEALAARAAGPVTVVAGATDVYPAHGEGRLAGNILDISRVDTLRTITQSEAGWRIGAAVTWRDVLAAPLPPAFDGLKAAAREVGAVQIQARGTVAGNLVTASPAGDGIPCLLTLDAAVELCCERGCRTLPVSQFLTGVRRTALAPDELVTAILIPTLPTDARGAFLKLGARHSLVISIAMVSAVLTLDEAGRVVGARVAVGACSPVATRLPALEAALLGRHVGDAAAAVDPAHLAPLAPISDVRATADYRREAAAELTRRALARCAPPIAAAA